MGIGFLVGGLISLLVPQIGQNEKYINPNGWNLPDSACLALKKTEKATYPGVPIEITVEYRLAQIEPVYYINNPLFTVGGSYYPNILVREAVFNLTIYKKEDGEILCYRYMRLLDGLTPESQAEAAKLPPSSLIIDGGSLSFVFDLDNDGIYESLIDAPHSEAEEQRLLISIIKLKLRIT